MGSLETFLPLVIVIWGIFSPGSAISKDLNETRNKILDAGSSYTLDHKKLIFNNDWKGMFWASLGYQAFLFVLIALLIWKFLWLTANLTLGIVCLALAVMSILRAIVHIKAFWLTDRVAIETYLESAHTSANSATV
jgi:hypothetical protein